MNASPDPIGERARKVAEHVELVRRCAVALGGLGFRDGIAAVIAAQLGAACHAQVPGAMAVLETLESTR